MVDNINGYLIAAPNVYIKSRSFSLYDDMPDMFKGSQPTDGNHLIFEADEYDDFITQYPNDKDLLRPYMGSYEFINKKRRYCLWLQNIEPSRYSHNKIISERLSLVREARLQSETESVRRDASTTFIK